MKVEYRDVFADILSLSLSLSLSLLGYRSGKTQFIRSLAFTKATGCTLFGGQARPRGPTGKKFDQYPIEYAARIRKRTLNYPRVCARVYLIVRDRLFPSLSLSFSLFRSGANLFPFVASFCFRFKAQSTTRNVILR